MYNGSSSNWLANLPQKECDLCGAESIFNPCSDCDHKEYLAERNREILEELSDIAEERLYLEKQEAKLREELSDVVREISDISSR